MINIKLLNEDAKIPTRATNGSAAFDLYSTEDILIIPETSEIVSTGIALEIPQGWFGLLSHRSSLAFKLDCVASLGFIDADYRGEVKIKLFNHGYEGVQIKKGDRVAQIAFIQSYQGSDIHVVSELTDTHRGEGGFGSTGD